MPKEEGTRVPAYSLVCMLYSVAWPLMAPQFVAYPALLRWLRFHYDGQDMHAIFFDKDKIRG